MSIVKGSYRERVRDHHNKLVNELVKITTTPYLIIHIILIAGITTPNG